MSPQKKITLFLGLVLFFSMFSYVPIVRAGSLEVAGGLFVLTLMWSPGVSALITQFIATRSIRGLGWRPGPARWLGLAYILPVLYALPVYAFVWLAGLGRVPNPELLAELSEMIPVSNPALAIAVYVVINATAGVAISLLTGLGEEIGWRGLFVPELAKVTTFTRTALISGAVWATWHMPGVFLADYNSGGAPKWYAALCFAALVLAISFPFAWLTLKSGSLWPAALLHASHNLFIQTIFDQLTGNTAATPFITGEFGIGMVLTGLVVAYVFWRRRQEVERQPEAAQVQPAIQPL